MVQQKKEGYSLKKKKLKKWIYQNKLTQSIVAKRINITKQELKEKLKNKALFNKKQIKKLIYMMGARKAFEIIYFPTKEERRIVFNKVFGKKLKEVEKGLGRKKND